jgi:hypothetical protein
VEPDVKVLPAVEEAWKANADLLASDTAGNTALHAAVSHRYPSVVQFLVEHGAPVNARNHAGRTPLLELLATSARPTERPVATTSATTAGRDVTEDSATEQIAAILGKSAAAK